MISSGTPRWLMGDGVEGMLTHNALFLPMQASLSFSLSCQSGNNQQSNEKNVGSPWERERLVWGTSPDGHWHEAGKAQSRPSPYCTRSTQVAPGPSASAHTKASHVLNCNHHIKYWLACSIFSPAFFGYVSHVISVKQPGGKLNKKEICLFLIRFSHTKLSSAEDSKTNYERTRFLSEANC